MKKHTCNHNLIGECRNDTIKQVMELLKFIGGYSDFFCNTCRQALAFFFHCISLFRKGNYHNSFIFSASLAGNIAFTFHFFKERRKSAVIKEKHLAQFFQDYCQESQKLIVNNH